MTTLESWSSDVLQFWFAESGPERWFNKNPAFDEEIRQHIRALHEGLASCEDASLLTDPRTALAAIIVINQMSRNMFRDTPRLCHRLASPLVGTVSHCTRLRDRPDQGRAHVRLSAVRAFGRASNTSPLCRIDGNPQRSHAHQMGRSS